MKHMFKKSAIAVAVGGLLASGSVFAELSWSKDVDIEETISYNNDVSVSIFKEFNVTKDLHIEAEVIIDDLDRAAVGLIDNKQVSFGNESYNNDLDNSAILEGSMSGGSGNIQGNMAAGDNNQQDNAAIIAVDAGPPFGPPHGDDDGDDNGDTGGGAADAQTFVFQGGHENETYNTDVDNVVSASGSLNASTGNLQYNSAAGSNNQQKNALAIAVADPAVLAESVAYTLQESVGNRVDNSYGSNTTFVSGSMNGVSGNAQVNFASGVGNQQSNSLAIAVKAD